MDDSRPVYILCGGASRRMGRDKALLPAGSRTLLEEQIKKCEDHFCEMILLSGSKTYALPFRHLFDHETDGGPLFGLLSALKDPVMKNKASDLVTLLAVDLSEVRSETLSWLATTPFSDKCDVLIAQCGSVSRSGNPVVRTTRMATDHENKWQPLLGLYHRRITEPLSGYLSEGKRSVKGFLETLRVQTFTLSDSELRNVNTADDYSNRLLTSSKKNTP